MPSVFVVNAGLFTSGVTPNYYIIRMQQVRKNMSDDRT